MVYHKVPVNAKCGPFCCQGILIKQTSDRCQSEQQGVDAADDAYRWSRVGVAGANLKVDFDRR